MLELSGLTKKFHSKTVVNQINIKIAEGELYSFLGPNGAGKTTTIKMMAGLLRPDSGTIVINGYDLLKDEHKAKQSFGFMPDQPFLYNRLTPREFLRFIGGLYKMDPQACDDRIDQWLSRFDLMKCQADLIGSFSHGMRQKLSLAAAFIHDPPVVIIDEPMVGLDPKGAVILKQLLKEKCSSGMTAFVSTHSLDVAEQLADRIGIIHEGNLIAEGSMDQLRSMVHSKFKHLENIFLELTESEDLSGIVASLQKSS